VFERNISIDEAKLFDQYQNLSSCKKVSTKCSLLWNDGTWKISKIFCNVQYHWILQQTDKDCTRLFQRYGSLR